MGQSKVAAEIPAPIVIAPPPRPAARALTFTFTFAHTTMTPIDIDSFIFRITIRSTLSFRRSAARTILKMTDDTPRTKPPPAEPTPAAAVSTAPGGERVADDDAAVAVALGRPTPSPDQVPPPTASPAGSNASSPRSARGDVEIGGGRSAAAAGAVEDAPEEQRRDAPSPEEDGGASAGGDGDGDAYRLVPLETPREKSDAGFPSRGDAEASRGEPFDEASSSDGARSEADDAGAPFAATPLAFKQQVAALAVATASSEENPASEEAMVAGDRLEREISPPRGRLSLSTPAATSNGFLPLSNPPSNFRTGGLFPGSLAETPDPMLADTNVCDFALLNDEVNAAASTASAMQYRPDGFESGALLPQYAPDDAGLYGAAGAASTSTAMTPGGWMDVGQFSRYPMPDAFSLPPYVQAHLDETYAASTVVFPPDRGGDGNVSHHGNVFFQVTAYRPGSDGRSAPGNTPPAVAGPPRGKALAQQQPGGLPANKPAAKRKGGRARPRPLPLRKRKLQANYDAGDVEYSPPPPAAAGKNKRVLVRHNIRGGEGEGRVTCRCSKSKCLKLYCDCFQQRKVGFLHCFAALFCLECHAGLT